LGGLRAADLARSEKLPFEPQSMGTIKTTQSMYSSYFSLFLRPSVVGLAESETRAERLSPRKKVSGTLFSPPAILAARGLSGRLTEGVGLITVQAGGSATPAGTSSPNPATHLPEITMIRLKCPGCGSTLSAKRQLVGATRNCPKCGTPVVIAPPDQQDQQTQEQADPALLPQGVADPAAPAAEGQGLSQPALPVHHWPERVDRRHHYLICDKAKLVAAWENNGNGWMLKTRSGLVSAARNREQLPAHGDFKLIELQIEHTEGGRRLVGLKSYQLASHWALTSLDRGDDPIMAKIVGLAGLNKDQKNAVRGAIKEQFMREVWHDCQNVLEYLANADYHSPGTN
jgi:predicted RNA-binding Zn-ribbon protein involved in translation (DUF1610 family)